LSNPNSHVVNKNGRYHKRNLPVLEAKPAVTKSSNFGLSGRILGGRYRNKHEFFT